MVSDTGRAVHVDGDRTVGSEWIAYGKRRAELFEVEVSDEKEYAQLIGDLEEEIGDSQRQQQRARVDAIVADAIGS